MEPTAAMAPLEVILKYPGPWLAWILPMIGALSMPLLSRFGSKVRDYGAVAWAFTSVISGPSVSASGVADTADTAGSSPSEVLTVVTAK